MSSVPRVYFAGSPLATLVGYGIARLPGQGKIPNVVMLMVDQLKLKRFMNHESQISLYRSSLMLDRLQLMAGYSVPRYANGDIAPFENLVIGGGDWRYTNSIMRKYESAIVPSTELLLLNPSLFTLGLVLENKRNKEFKIWRERPKVTIGVANKAGVEIGNEEFDVRVNDNDTKIKYSHLPETLWANENDSIENSQNSINSLMNQINLHYPTATVGIQTEQVSFQEMFTNYCERELVDNTIEALCLLFDCSFIKELKDIKEAIHLTNLLVWEKLKILKSQFGFFEAFENSTIIFDDQRILGLIKEKINKSHEPSEFYENYQRFANKDILENVIYMSYLGHKLELKFSHVDLISRLIKGKVLAHKNRHLSTKLRS